MRWVLDCFAGSIFGIRTRYGLAETAVELCCPLIRCSSSPRLQMTSSAVEACHIFRKENNTMRESKFQSFNFRKIGYRGGLLFTLLMAAALSASSQDDKKIETIDATAMGTLRTAGLSSEPSVVVPRDRHAVVDRLRQLFGVGGDDAITLKPTTIWLLPIRPTC